MMIVAVAFKRHWVTVCIFKYDRCHHRLATHFFDMVEIVVSPCAGNDIRNLCPVGEPFRKTLIVMHVPRENYFRMPTSPLERILKHLLHVRTTGVVIVTRRERKAWQ